MPGLFKPPLSLHFFDVEPSPKPANCGRRVAMTRRLQHDSNRRFSRRKFDGAQVGITHAYSCMGPCILFVLPHLHPYENRALEDRVPHQDLTGWHPGAAAARSAPSFPQLRSWA